MNPFRILLLAALAIAACSAVPAFANERPEEIAVVTSTSFLQGHPDLAGQVEGFRFYQQGDYAEAMKRFRRGARYGDKPSQGMIAEMFWNGQGVDVDRPRAHAWMSLAAERHYDVMVQQRDRFWQALTADERTRALDIARSLQKEHGDAVAQPRLDRVLRRERRKMTGSRTGGGTGGALRVVLRTPTGTRTVDGSQFYHPDYWEPERYRAFQDRDWKAPPTGVVEIGPLQTAETVEQGTSNEK